MKPHQAVRADSYVTINGDFYQTFVKERGAPSAEVGEDAHPALFM